MLIILHVLSVCHYCHYDGWVCAWETETEGRCYWHKIVAFASAAMLWPQTGTLLLMQNCGLCISRDAVATAHDRRWSTTSDHRLLTLIIFDCLSDNQWFLLIHLMPCRVQVCVVETRRQTSMPGSRPVKKPSPTLRRLHTVPLHDRSVIQATSLSPVFSVSWFGPSLSFIHITHIFSFTTYHCKVIDCQKQSVFWPTLYVCKYNCK